MREIYFHDTYENGLNFKNHFITKDLKICGTYSCDNGIEIRLYNQGQEQFEPEEDVCLLNFPELLRACVIWKYEEENTHKNLASYLRYMAEVVESWDNTRNESKKGKEDKK